MLVLIRGAGDIATGIALRLYRTGIQVVMTDLPRPTAIRRTVCFSPAITDGETVVEGVRAVRADSPAQALSLLAQGAVPVLPDPECLCREQLHPGCPGGRHTGQAQSGHPHHRRPRGGRHRVVETMRGHTLGRVIYQGSALPNTNIPGLIGGYAGERVLRAPADGIFTRILDIGDEVQPGDIAGTVNGQPMKCTIGGVVRGILPSGTPVHLGMKSGDVDPRCQPEYCTTASDKALAVGGGALEAILHLTGALR